MRPLRVVVLDVLFHQMIGSAVPTHDELVRALLLDRLDETLDVRLQVG